MWPDDLTCLKDTTFAKSISEGNSSFRINGRHVYHTVDFIGVLEPELLTDVDQTTIDVG